MIATIDRDYLSFSLKIAGDKVLGFQMVETQLYSWKDTNLALFGSDIDRAVKKESAEKEPAWRPVRNITSSTLMVWRIKDFKLEVVRPEDIGKFFRGDSYVVLNAKKNGNDEYGTAAYKTVELDTFLDDEAVQHREVDGFESDLFKSYFDRFELILKLCVPALISTYWPPIKIN
ncbi:Gelsolin-like protein 1 [Schistosoma japonicum]|nr:Gelsolin-like protein 1 [Schistosoma japonicum]